MKQGKYSLKELLLERHAGQLLIPEIQRDYVWPEENVKALLDSIGSDMKSKIGPEEIPGAELFDRMQPKFRELVERALANETPVSNIGFIYAYFDPEIPEQACLIDGQQRLTTLYLLLLALAVKENQQDYFRKTYFRYNRPQLSYKVRESARDFLEAFIPYVLAGGDVQAAAQENWYHNGYREDLTIKNLLANFQSIQKYLEGSPLTFDFVGEQVELWYFDTNKSAQGEELYIYMNSRGEPVQANENLKAALLAGHTPAEKNEYGRRWEEWQDFFWKNRGSNTTADAGFDEFLKWVKIIGYVLDHPGSKQEQFQKYIRSVSEDHKLNTEGLHLEEIGGWLGAVRLLQQSGLQADELEEWLKGKTSFADYIQLLPVLLYGRYMPATAQPEDLQRVNRFFENLRHIPNISKSPVEYAAQGLVLMHAFVQAGFTDIADMGELQLHDQYPNILTAEVRYKFRLYKDGVPGFSRTETEEAFWSFEDFYLSEGSVSLLFECMGIDTAKAPVSFDLGQFRTFSAICRALFDDPGDLLRRALLTFGDYSFNEGYSTSMEMNRYNFGDTQENWKDIFRQQSKAIIIPFLKAVFRESGGLPLADYTAVLQKMVDGYEDNSGNVNFIGLLIRNPELFRKSQNKRIVHNGSEAWVLKGKRAVNHDSVFKLEDEC